MHLNNTRLWCHMAYRGHNGLIEFFVKNKMPGQESHPKSSAPTTYEHWCESKITKTMHYFFVIEFFAHCTIVNSIQLFPITYKSRSQHMLGYQCHRSKYKLFARIGWYCRKISMQSACTYSYLILENIYIKKWNIYLRSLCKYILIKLVNRPMFSASHEDLYF